MPGLITVPVVDFGPFLTGKPTDKQEVAAEIDKAFQSLGFVTLHNHGIPKERITECFAWSEKFFALPESIKELAPHPPGGSHHRGWSGLGREKTSQHVYEEGEIQKLREVEDVKEVFDCGNMDDEMQPNIWLAEEHLPGFRAFMEGFFEDCNAFVDQILRALAIALDLQETRLSDTHKRSLYQLRLLHYPPVKASVLRSGEKARVSAHSDFGTLTLLFQDNVGGLEIQNPENPGTFLPVPPISDAVIVNCGDLMERWSNGRWKSDIHRVVAPPVDEAKSKENGDDILKSRYSIPFFAVADPDTIIDALPGCWDEKENPKKYDKTTAWEYVQMRMAAIYS